jgi:hypothetical protein
VRKYIPLDRGSFLTAPQERTYSRSTAPLILPATLNCTLPYTSTLNCIVDLRKPTIDNIHNPFSFFRKIWNGSSAPNFATPQMSSTSTTAVNASYQTMPYPPSPATPFEHAQATVFHNIRRPSRPVHNIASPPVFVFSANTSGASPTKLPALVYADGADMTNASFYQAPPTPFTSPSKITRTRHVQSPTPIHATPRRLP